MNRRLQWINLFGVLALAALCVFQWRINRHLNLENHRLEQVRMQQSAKLENQARISAGQTNDMDSLRAHLGRLTDELNATDIKLAASERQVRNIAVEREQLREAVTNWASAVAVRDERLKQLTTQLNEMAGERSAAIKSFNDLVARHNKLVQNWNDQQARLEALAKTNSAAGH